MMINYKANTLTRSSLNADETRGSIKFLVGKGGGDANRIDGNCCRPHFESPGCWPVRKRSIRIGYGEASGR